MGFEPYSSPLWAREEYVRVTRGSGEKRRDISTQSLSPSNAQNVPPLFSFPDRRPHGAMRYAWAAPLTREPRWLVPREHPPRAGHTQ
jgi:hypothetical protein